MIFLTSDIHHRSLGTGNQKCSDRLESELSVEFYRMAKERGIKLTYFISGQAFIEDLDVLKPVVADPDVEIGGHNFRCFEPSLWHRVSKKVWGSYPGPAWYEKHDIEKTVEIIERRSGRRITAWRNHMYLRGPNTDQLLHAAGIRYCSDRVEKESVRIERRRDAVTHIPINIMPDHEHLYHAERTVEWVSWWRKRYNWRDSFGPESYGIDEWREIVLSQVKAKRAQGAYACLIIHPITMYLCDKFASVRLILDEIARGPTYRMSDLESQVP